MAFIDKTKKEIHKILSNNIDRFYVYSLNADNIPFYIGKGKNNRIFYHEYEANNYGKIKSRLNMLKVNKLNKTIENKNLTYSIFSFFENEKKAFNEEIDLIKKYGRIDLNTGTLTNMTDGGDGAPVLNEDSKKSMIEKLTGRIGPNRNKKFDNEWRQNISEAKKGCTPWNKNSMMSDEAKIKMSEAKKGCTPWNKDGEMSYEAKDKMSKSHMGLKHSHSTKNKISQARLNLSKEEKVDITRKRLATKGQFSHTEKSKNKFSISNKNMAKIKTSLYYEIKNYIKENNIEVEMFRYVKSLDFMKNFYKEIKGE